MRLATIVPPLRVVRNFREKTMRIAVSMAMAALLMAACSKKEDAAKAPETSGPALAQMEGPKPGKWKMTTVMSAMPQPITAEVCIEKTTSFKEMQSANQQAGVTCTEQTLTRQGDAYVGHSSCTHQGGKVTIDSRFSGDFSSRYTMESKTVMDPPPNPAMREMTMSVTAERMGDC
jgi:hypothetical protein